jgi:hypothetical protein
MRKLILGLIAISLASCANPSGQGSPPGQHMLRFSQSPTMEADMQACRDSSNGLMRALIVCMQGKGYQAYLLDADGFQFPITSPHSN